jgi:predicted AlkP superfamily phosphohydrolase/phosphomutase
MITSPYSLETARGVFRVNEWLIQEGYLQVDSPTQVTSIDKVKVVWSKTSAWYSNNLGGLYFTFQKDSGKKEGRQANILHYSSEIAKKLESLQSPDGEQINLRAIPLDLYQSGAYQHLGPGLILEDAYGHWGLEDQIGYGVSGLFSRAGNLPCVPTSQGYFCLAGSTAPSRGEVDNLSLLNVAPTVFEVLRLEPRLDFEAGTIFSLPAKEDHPLAAVEIAGENKDDEATIRSRLEMLGY